MSTSTCKSLIQVLMQIQRLVLIFKKFMQVGVDVKCMHINFGGHSLFSFGDIATFKNGKNIPLSWTIVHGHQKI